MHNKRVLKLKESIHAGVESNKFCAHLQVPMAVGEGKEEFCA